MIRVLIILAVLLGAGIAQAYPQYQLSHDQTCTGCHIAPSGGGLLNENVLMTAETMSQLGTAPEFLNGAFELPSWLVLSGELRGSSGYLRTPEDSLVAFPMQAELSGTVKFSGVAVHAKGGYPGLGAPPVFSREHYIQWQSKEDEAFGVFVRAGRFMPVFGLRLAEHPTYTRKFGGTPLWGERYGVGLSYIDPAFEVHATGFIEEPLLDPVVRGNGGSLYAEYRLTETALVGVEGMFVKQDAQNQTRGGLVGKWYVAAANLLVSAEAQFVRQRIYAAEKADAPLQIIANLIGTFTLTEFFQVDLGVGHFDSNIRIKDLDRDAFDLNARYRLTSHLELQLNARLEQIGFGQGGPFGAYTLGQLHYRM
jgi:hypothetical protein